MANDGFGTLSAGLMERGTERARVVLDENSPDTGSIAVDMTFTPTRETNDGEPKWLATQVPATVQKGTFAPAPTSPDQSAVSDQPLVDAGIDQACDLSDAAPSFADSDPSDRDPMESEDKASLFGQRNGHDIAAAKQHDDDFGTLSGATNVSDPALPEALENAADRDSGPPANSFANQLPKIEIRKPYPHEFDASATEDAVSKTPTQNGFANAGAAALAAFEVNGHAPVADTAPADQATLAAPTDGKPQMTQNPVSGKHEETTERRSGSGASLSITQPKDGDMSQVTISIEDAPAIDPTPQKGGQRPSSITYERRPTDSLSENDEDTNATPVWIETQSYSGPDRRHKQISPEIERRKTVPPRIKVGVRLEQERYLRLKLASVETGRTQQDLVTCALDAYLDGVGVDRFARIAMGFGVASDGSQLEDVAS